MHAYVWMQGNEARSIVYDKTNVIDLNNEHDTVEALCRWLRYTYPEAEVRVLRTPTNMREIQTIRALNVEWNCCLLGN